MIPGRRRFRIERRNQATSIISAMIVVNSIAVIRVRQHLIVGASAEQLQGTAKQAVPKVDRMS
jgi:hypothetical protein